MEAGAAFRTTPQAQYRDRHLWVVISGPHESPDEVVIVNVTTYEPGKDDSCILEAGSHPFITHRSCVRYSGASVTSVEKIERAVSAGLVEVRDPVDARGSSDGKKENAV